MAKKNNSDTIAYNYIPVVTTADHRVVIQARHIVAYEENEDNTVSIYTTGNMCFTCYIEHKTYPYDECNLILGLDDAICHP